MPELQSAASNNVHKAIVDIDTSGPSVNVQVDEKIKDEKTGQVIFDKDSGQFPVTAYLTGSTTIVLDGDNFDVLSTSSSPLEELDIVPAWKQTQ